MRVRSAQWDSSVVKMNDSQNTQSSEQISNGIKINNSMEDDLVFKDNDISDVSNHLKSSPSYQLKLTL